MGKAAIINPYLDTMGGGEKYTLSFANVLKDLGYSVDVQWKNNEIKKDLSKRFGLNLNELNFVEDCKRGENYDFCFWVSDGSIPLLHARKNILHFQVPFMNVDGSSLVNKMKLFRVNKVICNSEFTKKIIDQEFGVKSAVVYPPIDTSTIKPKRKQNIILYVGRFSNLLQNKRQDVLIDQFKKLNLNDWKLVLAGGVEVGSNTLLSELKKSIGGFNIEIIESPDYKKIVELYGVSKIFWSASGYGTNDLKEPEKVEHFGMSVVESMSAGCVPVVYNAGGHKEIITNEVNGYLWKNEEELIEKTNVLITNKIIYENLSRNAISKASKFTYERFRDDIKKIL